MATDRVPAPTPPAPPAHVEGHFESTALVRDVVIGMSDGLDSSLCSGGGAFRVR